MASSAKINISHTDIEVKPTVDQPGNMHYHGYLIDGAASNQRNSNAIGDYELVRKRIAEILTRVDSAKLTEMLIEEGRNGRAVTTVELGKHGHTQQGYAEEDAIFLNQLQMLFQIECVRRLYRDVSGNVNLPLLDNLPVAACLSRALLLCRTGTMQLSELFVLNELGGTLFEGTY